MSSPTLDEQIKFYNEYWSNLNYFNSYKTSRIIKILSFINKARKNIHTEPKILDLGCGDGRCVAIWNEIGPSTGLDLSEQAMNAAASRFPYIQFYSGNATQTSFPAESFDIIISQEVLEHIMDQDAYLAECNRLLSNKGFLILTTPNKFYFDHTKNGNYSTQPIENIISPKTLRKIVGKFFIINKITSIEFPRAEYGMYFILTNKTFIRILRFLKLDIIRKHFMSRFLLGVHICLLAQKKS